MIEITKEIRQFREALVALVPIMDEAQITWGPGEQYDSFDTISEALFSAFVVDSLAEGDEESEALADYRYDFPPYCSSSGVEINVTNSNESGRFLRLNTKYVAFDSITCASEKEVEFELPFVGSRFYVL